MFECLYCFCTNNKLIAQYNVNHVDDLKIKRKIDYLKQIEMSKINYNKYKILIWSYRHLVWWACCSWVLETAGGGVPVDTLMLKSIYWAGGILKSIVPWGDSLSLLVQGGAGYQYFDVCCHCSMIMDDRLRNCKAVLIGSDGYSYESLFWIVAPNFCEHPPRGEGVWEWLCV